MPAHSAQEADVKTASEDLDPSATEGGNSYWFFGTLATIKVSGAETGGRVSIVETLAPPRSAPPLHVHRVDDEIFCVLEGELTLHFGQRAIALATGDVALAPRGVPHVYVVGPRRPARIVTASAPATFDGLVAAFGEPAPEPTLPPPPEEPPDLEGIAERMNEFGIEILGPPGTLPGQFAGQRERPDTSARAPAAS